MSNQVHLLLQADLTSVARFMKRLQVSYAAYFNKRYDRTGHLFQGRFGSVPIQTDEQLMAAVRYIHRNPIDIPGEAYESYEWSSYREYLDRPFVSSTSFVKGLFNGTDDFVRFHESWEAGPDDPISRNDRNRITDDEAVRISRSLLDVESPSSIASLGKAERDKCLIALRKAGLPIEQIARITGLGRNVIQRAK